MAFCLTKDQENKLRNALVDKKLDPFKLSDMSSEQRRAEFEKYVDPENAENINSLFESKLLLKNQIIGFQTWAKNLVGVTPKIKRDLLTKIDRLNELGVLSPRDMKLFMEDLARTRLGFYVTFEEAKEISDLSIKSKEAKTVWESELENNPEWKNDPHKSRNEWKNNQKRIIYGLSQVALENRVNEIKLDSKKKRVSFRKDPVKSLTNIIIESPKFVNDLFKSLMSSIDNSFFGRQGIKNLYGTPSQKRIWTNNFVKSFTNISKELRNKKINGVSPMDMIKAEIYSRPNAINGKYKAGDYQLNVLTEEVFPTSLPEKIPGLGRLFRASETAFNGSALRMRADLADMFISKMESQGLNALDKKEAMAVGDLIGSLTGRGKIRRDARTIEQLNFVMWSARFLKANFDTLTAHSFDRGATKFSKAEARKSLGLIIGHVAGLLMLAKFLDPESVEEDPRSTNFGRIKVFGKWVDITGGMRSLVILAARMTPTIRDGRLTWVSKSSTGKETNLNWGEFGSQDGVDVLLNTLLLNRLGPLPSVMRDMLRGELFGGDPFNIEKSIVRSTIPLSIQNVNQVKNEDFSTILGVAIFEFLGFGVSTYKFKSNWNTSTSKEMKSFKEQVGEERFNEANDSYNRAYNAWLESVKEDVKYKELSDEGKKNLERQARSAIKKRILDEYRFDRTKKLETVEELKEKDKIKSLKPISSLIKEIKDGITGFDLVGDVMAAENITREDWEEAKNNKEPGIVEKIKNAVISFFGGKIDQERELVSPEGEEIVPYKILDIDGGKVKVSYPNDKGTVIYENEDQAFEALAVWQSVHKEVTGRDWPEEAPNFLGRLDKTEGEEEQTPLPTSSIVSGFREEIRKTPNRNIGKKINISANKNDVEPAIMASLFFSESGFNPNAENKNIDKKTGRVKSVDNGIAQINTVAYPNVTLEQARDPNFAIPFATKIISRNLKKFDGDYEKAIAAYNRGAGRVGRNGIDSLGYQYLHKVVSGVDKSVLRRLGLKSSYKDKI